MVGKYTTPAYFSGFQCVAGECIGSCCNQWEVKADRQHYDALKIRMSDNPADTELFCRHVVVNEDTNATETDYAVIKMREDGNCSMLDKDGLCIIEKKYGADLLWNICRQFPRVVSKSGNNFEITGSLSCPEVTRLCLQAQDPYEMVSLPESHIPSVKAFKLNREMIPDKDPYTSGFEQVRHALLSIISDEQRDLKGRLLHLATTAHALTDFYFRGCPNFDPQRLSNTLKTVLSGEVEKYCDQLMHDYHANEPLATIMALSTLMIFQQQDASTLIGQLYSKIMAAHPTAMENEPLGAVYFADEIRRRRKTVDQELLQQLDQAVSRYVGNCLTREWFTDMPDTITYLQLLLARTAILRFLLLMHPALPTTHNKEELGTLLINVIYRFSREIDHNQPFLGVMFTALTEQQLLDYEHSAAFIDM